MYRARVYTRMAWHCAVRYFDHSRDSSTGSPSRRSYRAPPRRSYLRDCKTDASGCCATIRIDIVLCLTCDSVRNHTGVTASDVFSVRRAYGKYLGTACAACLETADQTEVCSINDAYFSFESAKCLARSHPD